MLGITAMNFSVHMDEPTLLELNRIAKEDGKSRSALLSEAFRKYLDDRSREQKLSGWPQVLVDHWNNASPLDLTPHPDFANTDDLKPLRDPVL
jgi:metal-responsive CopG/Arc/MetJ family transcriptional regulator